MKTLFDLRKNNDSEIYKSIENLYGESLKIVRFEDSPIAPCIGCWNCWLKTPGRCVMKDQMVECYSEYINSETVILLMDTAQGFINHKAKAFIDRVIPLYHPYIEIVNGECHHIARYKSYPNMVFYFEKNGITNQEEQIIEDYLYRTAYHFKSKAYRIKNNGNLQLVKLESREAKNKAIAFGETESMDKLVIYNGSPRKRGSNSAIILEKVKKALGDRVEIRDLKEVNKWDMWAETFNEEEHVMFFMPLYIHGMPSHVMAFFEKLQVSKGSISFFVQQGFPESSQSYYLVAYFEQLAVRLERTYLGTAIKGGVEGIQMRSSKVQDKMFDPMVKLITNLMDEGKFKPSDINALAQPIRFEKVAIILIKLICKFGLTNLMWNKQLKENGAFENRFDQPYLG
jgi:multimeric flavodoxin WrbA